LFIDHAEISVNAGNGGNGSATFRREKYVPRGGPDGGDGGAGGSVYIVAQEGVNTLLDFAHKHKWSAERGFDGMGQQKYGLDGKDLILKVPPGTIIRDTDHGLIIKDLKEDQMIICVAKGGRGGRGNIKFASATNQAPREAEDGKVGQSRNLNLELKLIADIGLVGLPNAGKSTLISRISKAKPKIAPYPFTTLIPNLGIVELSDYRRVVIADLPGLIEGSHEGHGLGHDFLKHIERTRVIAHLVDIANIDGSDPLDSYNMIRKELSKYSKQLANKIEIIIASKMDLDPTGEQLAAFETKIGKRVIPISSVSGMKLPELKEAFWEKAKEAKAKEETANATKTDSDIY
jgi:GTP-binding protein